MAETRPHEYIVKLLMMGDSGVGKSCVVRRFKTGTEFSTSSNATIGIDFEIKFMEVLNKSVKVQLWDTAGQEKFRTITGAYYKGAMGVLLCYDVSAKVSFQKLRKWLAHVARNAPEGRGLKVVLVGNKCDTSARQVSRDQGQRFAQEHKLSYFETSAKTGEGVNEVFDFLVSDIVSGFIQNPSSYPRRRPSAKLTEQEDSKGCCT